MSKILNYKSTNKILNNYIKNPLYRSIRNSAHKSQYYVILYNSIKTSAHDLVYTTYQHIIHKLSF